MSGVLKKVEMLVFGILMVKPGQEAKKIWSTIQPDGNFAEFVSFLPLEIPASMKRGFLL